MLINHPTKTGFTVIEMLVVATIMAVLMTIGLVSYAQTSRSSRNAKRKADLESVRQALVLYNSDNDTYPDPASDGDNQAFLDMLVTIIDYINSTSIVDPKTGTYDYTYSSTGSTFELCATLEIKSGTESYCINNP